MHTGAGPAWGTVHCALRHVQCPVPLSHGLQPTPHASRRLPVNPCPTTHTLALLPMPSLTYPKQHVLLCPYRVHALLLPPAGGSVH